MICLPWKPSYIARRQQPHLARFPVATAPAGLLRVICCQLPGTASFTVDPRTSGILAAADADSRVLERPTPGHRPGVPLQTARSTLFRTLFTFNLAIFFSTTDTGLQIARDRFFTVGAETLQYTALSFVPASFLPSLTPFLRHSLPKSPLPFLSALRTSSTETLTITSRLSARNAQPFSLQLNSSLLLFAPFPLLLSLFVIKIGSTEVRVWPLTCIRCQNHRVTIIPRLLLGIYCANIDTLCITIGSGKGVNVPGIRGWLRRYVVGLVQARVCQPTGGVNPGIAGPPALTPGPTPFGGAWCEAPPHSPERLTCPEIFVPPIGPA